MYIGIKTLHSIEHQSTVPNWLCIQHPAVWKNSSAIDFTRNNNGRNGISNTVNPISSHLLPPTCPNFGSGLLALRCWSDHCGCYLLKSLLESRFLLFTFLIFIFGPFKSEQKWNKENHFVWRGAAADTLELETWGDELLKFLKGEFLSSRWRSIIMGGLCVINHIMREVISGRTHHDDRPATEGYERKRNSVPLSQCSVISSKTGPRERCNFVQSSDRHRRVSSLVSCKVEMVNPTTQRCTQVHRINTSWLVCCQQQPEGRNWFLIYGQRKTRFFGERVRVGEILADFGRLTFFRGVQCKLHFIVF